jgi:hypothetical protein
MTILASAALLLGSWYFLAAFVLWRLIRIPGGESAVVEIGQLGDGPAWAALATHHHDLPAVFANSAPSFLLISNCPAIASIDDSAKTVALLGASSASNSYLEYKSRFADGQELMTNNSTIAVGLFVSPHIVRQFPEIKAPDKLLAAHLALVGGDGRRTAPMSEEIVRDIKRDSAASVRLQVASGYFRREGDVLRLTPVGALRAAFMQTPPLLWIRRAHRRKRDRAALDQVHAA